ncbi:MAG: hypothetical protein ACYTAF_03080 [Planctomycetota bacterium]
MRSLFLILIPGIGPVRRGSPGRGILYFFLFALLLNVFLMAPFLAIGPEARLAALAGAALVWTWNARDTLRAPRRKDNDG